MSKCDDCGLVFYYSPEYHECSDKGSPALKAEAERLRGESWVE